MKPFLSTGSERGAFAYLELAVAYESLPDGQSRAITIYKMLRGTPVKEVAQSAKQLLFGIDAMRNLDVQAYADSEESKLVVSVVRQSSPSSPTLPNPPPIARPPAPARFPAAAQLPM